GVRLLRDELVHHLRRRIRPPARLALLWRLRRLWHRRRGYQHRRAGGCLLLAAGAGRQADRDPRELRGQLLALTLRGVPPPPLGRGRAAADVIWGLSPRTCNVCYALRKKLAGYHGHYTCVTTRT